MHKLCAKNNSPLENTWGKKGKINMNQNYNQFNRQQQARNSRAARERAARRRAKARARRRLLLFLLALFLLLLSFFIVRLIEPNREEKPAQSLQESSSQPASTTSESVPVQSESLPSVSSSTALGTDTQTFADQQGYREENAQRYAAWAQAHPEHTPAQTVGYVNVGLDQEFYSQVNEIEDPDNLLVLCNKYHKLPDGYEPADLTEIQAQYSNGKTVYLRAEAAQAFEQLCQGAAEQGYTILGQSGFRSYSYQQQLYNNYVQRDGQAAADTYSARPGYSEHQTGLAMDICNGTLSYTEFGQTAEYQWVRDHLHEYGFVLHYLPDTQWITGYMTEEWHIRYVGVEAATQIYQLGITLDEYCALYL